jgi:lipoprotein-anchoring transpeptidase ErfK/SrfK
LLTRRQHQPGTAGQPAPGSKRRTRAAAIVVAVVLALGAAGWLGYGQVRGPGHARAAGSPGPAARAAHGFVPPAHTLLATTHGAIPKFARPGGPQTGRVPGHWHYARSTLPVIARRAGWLDVRLAQRPNESTAWVRSRDVTLTTTPYAIVIDLAQTHLHLYRSARQILDAPVGVGMPQYPTPPGRFFAAFFAAPPTPGYGAFVMVTSAHSNVITDWDMSGDAMVAIHGPLGSGAAIGTTGARVSHGCIRMHEQDLLHLRDVPAGSPIYIFSA